MPFSYDKLWQLLVRRKMSKDELRVKAMCSQTTIVKLGRNENVSLDIIDRICEQLQCHPFEILEYIPNKEAPEKIDPLRGEVYLADINVNDRLVTHPVLIMQKRATDEFIPTVIIVPFSDYKTDYYMAHLGVPATTENGLTRKSYLLLDQIQTINKSQLIRKIGELESTFLSEADFIGRKVLGFD